MRYRCYILDPTDRIAEIELVECDDDGEARARAVDLLAGRPAVPAVEVWDGGRRVHRASRVATANAA